MNNASNAPSWDELHYELISLWDIMQRFRLDKFIKAYQFTASFCQTDALMRQMNPSSAYVGMSKSDYSELVSDLETLADLLEDAGLPLSALSATEAIKIAKLAVPGSRGMMFESGPRLRLDGHLREIQNRVRDEFVMRHVLIIPPNMVAYYAPNKPLFGGEVDRKFTSATLEIKEAAKCLALSRHTACVFHSMRIMEIGIRGIARCLGIPDPVKPAERNWGKVLASIEKAIEAKRPTLSSEDREYFDRAYVALDKIRSLWRNPTMHVEKTYLQQDASDIFDAVRIFMRTLASRLDEDGLPLA